MTTKREYLKSKGITVGARGRFSGAAKVALQEAEKAGIKFAAEKVTKAKQQPSWGWQGAVGAWENLSASPIFGIIQGSRKADNGTIKRTKVGGTSC